MSGGPFSPKTTSANQTSVQQTTLTTRNDNISGNTAPVINSSDGGTSVYAPSVDNHSFNLSSDFGAIDAGAHLGSQGISAAVTSASLVAQVAGDASNLAAASYHDAANIVADNSASTSAILKSISEHAVDVVAATSQDSQDNAYNFATSITKQFGSSLAQYQLAEQTQLGNTVAAINDNLGNTVAALNASYRDANTSSDQRIQDIAQSSQDLTREIFKYVAIAVAVAALAYAARRGLPK
jgi:hypothetical protein